MIRIRCSSCSGNIFDDFEDGKAMEVVGETHGTMLVRTGGFPLQLP